MSYTYIVRTLHLTQRSDERSALSGAIQLTHGTFNSLMPIVLENEDEGVVPQLNPATDRMLTRIKDVYLYILDRGIVTTENVVEEFGITNRTAQRDLNVLEYNELITSPARGKWTTTQKKVKLPS